MGSRQFADTVDLDVSVEMLKMRRASVDALPLDDASDDSVSTVSALHRL